MLKSSAGGGEKRVRDDFAERLRQILFEVQPELAEPGLNDWLQEEYIPQMPNAVVFANGRFQGLFPKTDAEHGIGGHPGLIFRLMLIALLLGTNNIAISYSTKEDDETNPLSSETKKQIFNILIPALKETIITLLTKNRFDPAEVRQKVAALNIQFFPLTNLFSTVGSVGRSFPGVKRLVMVTGLEQDRQGNDYNKYETTFKDPTKVGFTDVDFVLNSRQSQFTISGTKIREAVLNNYYDELGRYLLEANLTSEEAIRAYGNIIYEMKTKLIGQASQTEDEYANTLLDNMILAALEKLDRLKELVLKFQEGSLDENEGEELAYLRSKEAQLREFAVLEKDSGSASAGGGSYEDEEESGGRRKRRRRRRTRKQKSKKSKKSIKDRKTGTRKLKPRHTRGKNKNKNKK